MANLVYPKFKQAYLSGQINLTTAMIKVMAVNTAGGTTQYTYNSAHEFVSSVAASTRVATSPALSGVTVTNGTLDAADLTPAFSALSGQQFEALILFIDTGNEATSRLIAMLDTATGLAFTPDGSNVNITWASQGIIDF